MIEVKFTGLDPVGWAILSVDDLDGAVNVHMKSPIAIDAHSFSLHEFELQCSDGTRVLPMGASIGADFARFHLDLLFPVSIGQLEATKIVIRIARSAN